MEVSGGSAIASPSEADGASAKDEEDERSESQPETGTGHSLSPNTEVIHLVLCVSKEGDIDTECDEGQDSCEEGGETCDEGDGEVLAESEEESDEAESSGDGCDGQPASPGGAYFFKVGVGGGLNAKVVSTLFIARPGVAGINTVSPNTKSCLVHVYTAEIGSIGFLTIVVYPDDVECGEIGEGD